MGPQMKRLSEISSLVGCGTLFISMVLLLSTLAQSAGANVHPAGSLASSKWVGVAFRIPQGFQGTYDQEAGAFILQGSDSLIAVYGASQGDVETMGHVTVDAVRDLGVSLQPISVTSTSPNQLDARFSAWYEGQPRTVVGTVRKSAHGGVISLLAMGATGAEHQLQQHIASITHTLKWSPPQGIQQRARLVGKSLFRSGGSSDGRSGVGGFTASTSSKSQIDFCGDGQYLYQSKSESIISTAGASMPSSSSSSHQGRWWLVAGLGGEHYLYLESNQGDYYLWPIHESNQGANVNGQDYQVSMSSLCR